MSSLSLTTFGFAVVQVVLGTIGYFKYSSPRRRAVADATTLAALPTLRVGSAVIAGIGVLNLISTLLAAQRHH